MLIPTEHFEQFARDLGMLRQEGISQVIARKRGGPHWRMTKRPRGVSIIFKPHGKPIR